jgi:hypothetical protein
MPICSFYLEFNFFHQEIYQSCSYRGADIEVGHLMVSSTISHCARYSSVHCNQVVAYAIVCGLACVIFYYLGISLGWLFVCSFFAN